MDEIVEMLKALKDDHPNVAITRKIIEAYIEDNLHLIMDELVDQVIGEI